MDRKRISLDNPALAGMLRYENRSTAYSKRPVQPATLVDMQLVRRPARTSRQPVASSVSKPSPLPVTLAPQQSTAVPPRRPLEVAGAEPTRSALRAPEPEIDQLIEQIESEEQIAPEQKKRRLSMPTKHTFLYAMAGVVFAAGILVSLNGFRANRQVAAQVKQSQATSEATGDASHTAPSTVKPSAAAVRNYAVSPNLPRYIDIPKLKVHTRVLSEGVDRHGELQVPWNIYDVGWYNASSQPGQNGAELIDGHSGIGKTHGVFYQLASLVAGDPITITRGDHKTFTYKVVKVQTVDAKTVDMNSMLVSADTAKPGLNLITCTGDQIPGTFELNKRVQVYAVMQ